MTDIGAVGRQKAAADAVSCAFHKDEIGLDVVAAGKLNCDEVEERKFETTHRRG